MSEKTLKFDNIKVNEKLFQKSKQLIDLDLVNVVPIVILVISDKFKYYDDRFKYFIGYKDDIVKSLSIILLLSNILKKVRKICRS